MRKVGADGAQRVGVEWRVALRPGVRVAEFKMPIGLVEQLGPNPGSKPMDRLDLAALANASPTSPIRAL
jgi:hypothetical protein